MSLRVPDFGPRIWGSGLGLGSGTGVVARHWLAGPQLSVPKPEACYLG